MDNTNQGAAQAAFPSKQFVAAAEAALALGRGLLDTTDSKDVAEAFALAAWVFYGGKLDSLPPS